MSRGTLCFITGNKNKLVEVIALLGDDFPFKLVSKKVDLNEYQGDEDFIVRSKCREAVKLVRGPVIVEDTSLGFGAFGGLPGPYIKHFLDSIGPSGLYRMLKDWEDKSALAACRFGFCENESSDPIIFKGVVKGTIVEPRGSTGFGFDYCFQPEGSTLTFSEMSSETKNKVSHRFAAVKAMREYFLSKRPQIGSMALAEKAEQIKGES